MNPSSNKNPNQNVGEKSPWRATLCVMFIAQLLSIVGFSFVLPFIPFYIRELGVTDEKMVPFWTGILGASSGFTMTIFSPFWGWLADRYGRKAMVERAMFAGGVVTIAMGMVGNVYQLLICRLISGAFSGTISASISLVTSILPSTRLGFGLGIMQVAVFLGMSFGPWIGGIIADTVGYRRTFIAGGVLLLVGGLLVLTAAKENFERPSPAALKKNGNMRTLIGLPGIVSLMAIFFLFNFSINLAIPIIPLFIEEVGNLKTKVASTTGLLLAISGVTASLSAAAIGRLSDRLGHQRTLIINMFLTSLTWLAHGLAQSIGQLFVVRTLFGLAAGGNLPTMNALVAKFAQKESYGKAYGLMTSMTCLGMTLGPLTGGVLASYMGLRWAFFAVCLLLLLTVIPLVVSLPKK